MTIGRGWRWWLTERSPVIEGRVFSGEALALVGDSVDGLRPWALEIDPARPVLDLQSGRPIPTVGQVRRAFGRQPMPIVLANKSERVTTALGAVIQPTTYGWRRYRAGRPMRSSFSNPR